MLYVHTRCPLCDTGLVGFRRCSDRRTIVLMCDECDAVWKDPREIASDSAAFPAAPDFTIVGTNCSVASPGAIWAERRDVEAMNWEQFIAGQSSE